MSGVGSEKLAELIALACLDFFFASVCEGTSLNESFANYDFIALCHSLMSNTTATPYYLLTGAVLTNQPGWESRLAAASKGCSTTVKGEVQPQLSINDMESH